jgi:hypothetical protein
MTIKDRILNYRKKRAIKRHDTAKYFHIVGLIAKGEADKEVKEKLKNNYGTERIKR